MRSLPTLFFTFFRQYPWHFVWLILLAGAQAVLNGLAVIAVAPVTDFLLDKPAEDMSAITRFFTDIGLHLTLLGSFIFFGSLLLLNGIAGIMSRFAVLKVKYDVLSIILTDLVGTFFSARFVFFQQENIGTILNSLQREVEKVSDSFGKLVQFSVTLLQVIVFIGVPLFLNFKLTVTFLLLSVMLTAPLWVLRQLSYNKGKNSTQTANKVSHVLHQILSGAITIISFGRQKETVEKYSSSFREHAAAAVTFTVLQGALSLAFVPLATIAALISVYLAHVDGVSLSEVAVILFALTRIIPLAGTLLQAKTSVDGFVPAFEQLETLRVKASNLYEHSGSLPYRGIKEEISLNQVWYSYTQESFVLKNVNISIKPGQLVAFVGPSGSGKTSTANLILGLDVPTKGTILIDGEHLAHYDQNSFRRRLGYVPQDPFLFNTSIKENILWANPTATDKKINTALELAYASEFISTLRDRENTIVGDRGAQLSGGQRQRIALARAIVRDPDLIVLDEATSALDSESEELIQQSIQNLPDKTTVIVISHRLSTVRNSDHVYIFDEGSIAEEGEFSELICSPNSHLARLIRQQSISTGFD